METMIQRDNQEILEQELLPVIHPLYNFAYHLTGSREEAEDLVQETYLRAIKSIGRYQEGSNPKAWLFTILKNYFINEYRRRVNRPQEVDFEQVAETIREEENGSAQSPEYLTSDIESWEHLLSDEVLEALQKLKEEYRIVLIMADLEDFKYEEIAEMLEVPIGTVRSRLHRARLILGEALAGFAHKQGYTNYRSIKH